MRVPWLCRDLQLQSPLPPTLLEQVLKERILPFVDEPPAQAEKPYMGSVSTARFLLYPLGAMLPEWRPQARGRVRPEGEGSVLEVEVGLRPANGAAVHLLFACLVVGALVGGLAMAARGELIVFAFAPAVLAAALFTLCRWRFCRDADCIERFLREATRTA